MPIPQNGAEIYTPAPEQASGSFGRSLLNTAGQIGYQRSTTLLRTMRHGTSRGKGAFATYAGWKHTADELENFSGHGAGFKIGNLGGNWRSAVWGNDGVREALQLPGGRGAAGIMGTRWAPSSWMSAMNLLDKNPQGTNMLWNMAHGNSPSAGIRGALSEAGNFIGPQSLGGSGAFIGPRQPLIANAGEVMNDERRLQTINKFIGLGKDSRVNPVGNLMRGLMYDLKEGVSVTEGAGGGVAKLFGGKVGGLIDKGATMVAEGAGSLGSASAFGAGARAVFGVTGAMLTSYNWASTAYMAGKAVYKGWETYAIKAPLAAYQAVGRQLSRGAFSSGDATLLTGVPASNRMRAVQAIQGSRMNARSALGGEASHLAGHFG